MLFRKKLNRNKKLSIMMYKKYEVGNVPVHMVSLINNVNVPFEYVYICPIYVKRIFGIGKWDTIPDKWEVYRIYNNKNKITENTLAVLPSLKKAIMYSYERYVIDKLSGVDVYWYGPDPKEFL